MLSSDRLTSLGGASALSARANGVGLAILRVAVGLMWLYNVAWKKAPSFGQDTDSGLYRYTSDAVSHPVLAPYSWIVEHVVLPNFQAFGWVVLAVESLLAILLISGLLTRFAAGLGVLQSLAIGLWVANAPNEWPWSYWLMIGAHVVLFCGAASQRWSLDSVLTGTGGETDRRRRLALGWGVIGLLTAGWAIVGSLRSGSPGVVGSKDLAVAVGSYGVAGTVALVIVGGLLVLSGLVPWRVLRPAAGIVAAAAAIGVYSQAIDGTNTSAAFLLCFAATGAVTALRARDWAGDVATKDSIRPGGVANPES